MSVPATVRSVVHVAKMTGVSGMEGHLLALLPGLQRCGLDIRLIILIEPDRPLDAYAAQMRSLGVPTEQVIIRRDLDLGVIGTLANAFRGTDAVHTHLIHADIHGLLAAKRAGVKRIFCTAHNDDRFRRYVPIRLIQGWLWRQVSGGIAISEAIRQFVIKFEYAPSTKVHTVYYGLDPAVMPINPGARETLRREFGLPPDAKIAGSVCRLTTQKGVTYAISAIRKATERMPDLHYVIIGDGPLRASLETQVAAEDSVQRVHFLGWRDDARALMAAFDVLLVPSLWEGFGLVLLETMAARLPIIASRVSALPEIVIEGQTGYLVPPADPAALARRINDLLSDPARARQMGENGRLRLEQTFSVANMVQDTLNKLYQA